MFVGAMSFMLPLLTIFRTYDEGGPASLGWYARLANWFFTALTPELLTSLLAMTTILLYLWFRPRKQNVLWDLNTR